MFTLLPEHHKKRLYQEYRMRLLVIVLIFISLFFIIGCALLFPSYISLKSEKTSYETELDSLTKQVERKDKEGLTGTMNTIGSNLAIAKPDETMVYRALGVLLAHVTTDIKITSMSYTRGSQGASFITTEGIAKDRTSLISFSNGLKKELIFEKVDLPVSNLAKQTDVPFSMTLLGKF